MLVFISVTHLESRPQPHECRRRRERPRPRPSVCLSLFGLIRVKTDEIEISQPRP